jgi:hypothetical protein
MDYQRFYRDLFAPLAAQIGPIDRNTMFAIIGFDCGGPLNFCTIDADRGKRVITYVSCELAFRQEQIPSEVGRYELLCSCDDEQWVRSHLTDLGRMSFDTKFGHGHTVDIGVAVAPDAPIQGVVFENQSSVTIDAQSYGVLRVIGITRAEMDYKLEHGLSALVRVLKASHVYPDTLVDRASVI